MTKQVQEGVQKEILKHRLHGNPIFYEEDNILIMENPDGKKFEINLEDDEIKIIRELDE
ncbi:hypothetical protein [Mastigocoleus sp. MO_188.B34]|uniref:hypothetical protein n=1 Tax=Mastigocoleus sp. MO_188.B34 TaxID=3036635 RepID=UPI002633A404|nr:hypothetical protein [Mastigocoleus sp. MO_188.B34]MDJ0696923.1 hypothetical protein [Mastigocoleus sp. MO_188.B34]